MSLAKTTKTLTQLTGSGTSISLDASGGYSQTLAIQHVVGSGTPTTAGTIAVQVKAPSGARWYTLTTLTTTTGVATPTDQYVLALPPEISTVQLVYTAPSPGSSLTVDAEMAVITGI